ncbi:DnaJ protein homolog 1-like protein [Drosera capensis]
MLKVQWQRPQIWSFNEVRWLSRYRGEGLCSAPQSFYKLSSIAMNMKPNTNNPREVVKPDQFKAVDDEGNSNLPEVKVLESVLPPKATMQLTVMELDECKETPCMMLTLKRKKMRRKQAQAQEAYV